MKVPSFSSLEAIEEDIGNFSIAYKTHHEYDKYLQTKGKKKRKSKVKTGVFSSMMITNFKKFLNLLSSKTIGASSSKIINVLNE